MGRFKEFGKKFMGLRTSESYWRRAIRRRKKVLMSGKAIGVLMLTAWLYYRSGWPLLVLWPLGVWYYRSLEMECIEKKKSEFLVQFKEAIQSMSASLHTGYSVENAVKEAQKEMLLMYPKDEMICKELSFMVQQVYIKIPAEQIFEDFAKRIRLDDVRSFANVFAAAKRSGGDMIAIIQNTVNQIGDKIDVKREIDTLLAAKRYEFKVMAVIPYVIIAYMIFSFPEFMDCLYENVIGTGVMSVCLLVYLAAYAIGVRLVKIEV